MIDSIRQELVELKKDGWTKRRRRLGEMEQRQQTLAELHSKWKRASQKQNPLHTYIKELTDDKHLIPQTILGKQAKLAQCLHLMEVYMRQTALVEQQNRRLAQLLAQQAGQEEEEQSNITLELMNELCILDTELQELRGKLKELKCHEDETSGKEDYDTEESTPARSHDEKDALGTTTAQPPHQEEDSRKKNPWWWPIQHGDEKQKAPPISSSNNNNNNMIEDAKSIASDSTSSLLIMDLLWMPAKFKPQAAVSPKPNENSLPVTTVALQEESPSSSTHSSSGSSGCSHAESISERGADLEKRATPVVARQWWPTISPDMNPTTTITGTSEEHDQHKEENPQHWWESFYRRS
jgi:hypothetical protein